MTKNNQKLAIYQTKDGALQLRQDFGKETIWATQAQISSIFGVERSVITKHINNIFKDSELDKKVVCAFFAHTTQHGALKGKTQTKQVVFYNLDIILAIGYRTNSAKAIEFRKWATKTLKQHITQGFTINPKRIEKNHQAFLKAVEDIKLLTQNNQNLQTGDILELIKFFDEMSERYFLNYNLKIKEFRQDIVGNVGNKDFCSLSLGEQKKMFVAMLDNNQMYVNKTEMADKKFGVSKEDQNLTSQFYNSEK